MPMLRLTRAQVREVDRLAIEKYHVPGIVLMENAARAVADVAWEMAGNEGEHLALVTHFFIFCGGGNNGGDGYAAARHLRNRTRMVTICAVKDPATLTGDARTNFEIARAMEIKTEHADDLHLMAQLCLCSTEGAPWSGRAVIVDAIFGTGLTSAPRPPFDRIAAMINDMGLPVLAVDLPSGLDCDSGRPFGSCIRATTTVTFVAEKAGFANPESKQYTGEVLVGDIGCPREVIEEVIRGAG
jgi:NAD(P)H-hydrate epimerase